MNETLSEREREILNEVVTLYLERGGPIASSLVARSSSTGLSSASIRNVMAALEKRGYLSQPHTSAGRVPTDLGMRSYVHGLLPRAALSPVDRKRLRRMLSSEGPIEDLLQQVSGVLARVTLEVGVAVTPSPHQAALRSVHFVHVAENRVLAIVVTLGGVVDSRLLTVERDYTPAVLERISAYCTENFAGLTLSECRLRLLSLMAEERAKYDELLAGVVELGNRTVGSEAGSLGEVFLQGTARLLERAQASQLESLRRLFAAFSDKAMLVTLLNQLLAVDDPQVMLGSGISIGGGGDIGVILSSFQLTTGEQGLVGVIGLKRMNYPLIIPVVDFVGHFLGDLGSAPEAWNGR
jgi:heat-inducible transcriptional repressor